LTAASGSAARVTTPWP